MIIRESLWDLSGRTVCLGRDIHAVVDGLLRLQNTKDHAAPITLYLVGSPTTPPPSPNDALMLCSVLRSLRSPVTTAGMGLLHPTQTLVLASGTHRRCLLPHAMVSLAPLLWQIVQRPLGLHASATAPDALLDSQLSELLCEIKLEPDLFATERLLTAEQAIAHRLADEIVRQSPAKTGKPKNRKYEREP